MQDFIGNYVGPEYAVQAYWAAIVVAAFLALFVVWLVYRLLRPARLGSNRRAKQARLAITDAAKVDDRRSLVLLRRDDVEHLIMIGGPTDIVIEGDIRRNAPARPLAATHQEPVVPARSARQSQRVVTPPSTPAEPGTTPDPAPAPASVVQRPPTRPETPDKSGIYPPAAVDSGPVARPQIKKTVRVAPVSQPTGAENSPAHAATAVVAATAASAGNVVSSFADEINAAPETIEKAADGVAEFAKAAVARKPEAPTLTDHADQTNHAAMFADANATDTALSSQQDIPDVEEFVPLVASASPAPKPVPDDQPSKAAVSTEPVEPTGQTSAKDRNSDDAKEEMTARPAAAASNRNGNGVEHAKQPSMVDQMDALLNEIGPRN